MQGFPDKDINKLEDYGFIASRPRGEYHANNQQMAKLLHKAIGLGGKGAAPMEAYQAYENHQNNAPVAVLRDALRLEPIGPELELDEVEPTAKIMERFCTGGMSLGAISRETHETISIAMNRIKGGRMVCSLCACDTFAQGSCYFSFGRFQYVQHHAHIMLLLSCFVSL